ncbi:MAG: phosphate signaling complex protein PhoU [Acidimicrobiia bacterium]|nr:phosphate signaling complex protein PhoU [Acidimicrobiia bacterium]
MTEDLRKILHQEIDDIMADVVRLGALTCEAVTRATEALLSGDLEETQRIIDGDDELDALTVSVEERCFSTLALQSPMASDLRAIVATIKIAADVERSADLMVNVAKATRRIYGVTFPPRVRGMIQQMGDESCRLFRLAIDAYTDRNGSLGVALRDIDDRLDHMQNEFVQIIFESHGTGGIDLQAAVQLALVARFYERVGDHAVNIGERVRFMADGVMPEHTGAARYRALHRDAAASSANGAERGTVPGSGAPASPAAPGSDG